MLKLIEELMWSRLCSCLSWIGTLLLGKLLTRPRRFFKCPATENLSWVLAELEWSLCIIVYSQKSSAVGSDSDFEFGGTRLIPGRSGSGSRFGLRDFQKCPAWFSQIKWPRWKSKVWVGSNRGSSSPRRGRTTSLASRSWAATSLVYKCLTGRRACRWAWSRRNRRKGTCRKLKSWFANSCSLSTGRDLRVELTGWCGSLFTRRSDAKLGP